MGDVILFEPVLRGVHEAWPLARLCVLARDAYVGLGELLAPYAEWWGTALDPQRQGPEADPAELARISQRVGEAGFDLVVACTGERTWLDLAIGSAAPAATKYLFASAGEDPFFGPQARKVFGRSHSDNWRVVSPAGGDQDWAKNLGLVSALAGNFDRRPPALPSGPWREAAAGLLRGWGLRPKGYVVCAAAGFAHVPIKTWPPERFAALVREVCAPANIPTLLIGNDTERSYLERLATDCGHAARVWTGGRADWAVLCSLLAHSQACVGNDTGALHLAAAVGTPVVGVFGGGTWPRFIPAGPGAALVNPLPCFGCGWDCAFSDAPCIKLIATEDVAAALREVLAQRPSGPCEVRPSQRASAETRAVMEAAAHRFRDRARVLQAREANFQETVVLARDKDAEIALLKRETDAKDREIAHLKEEADGKDREIAHLKEEADGKDREIALLKQETDLKDVEIEALKRETDAKDGEIRLLKRTADERLRLLESLDASLREKEHALQELARAMADLQSAGRDKELVIRDLKFAADLRLAEIEKLHEACRQLQAAAGASQPG